MNDELEIFVKEHIDAENNLSNAGRYIIQCICEGKTKVTSNNDYTKLL